MKDQRANRPAVLADENFKQLDLLIRRLVAALAAPHAFPNRDARLSRTTPKMAELKEQQSERAIKHERSARSLAVQSSACFIVESLNNSGSGIADRLECVGHHVPDDAAIG